MFVVIGHVSSIVGHFVVDVRIQLYGLVDQEGFSIGDTDAIYRSHQLALFVESELQVAHIFAAAVGLNNGDNFDPICLSDISWIGSHRLLLCHGGW